MKKRIDQLESGDLVDLQGDKYADAVDGHPEFEFEFEVVEAVVRETDRCSVVHFESGFSCGFPPDHLVEVDQ